MAARLTVWYAVAAFALVAAATGYLYWGLARTLDHEDDQFLDDKVRDVRHVLTEHPGDREALRRELVPGRLSVRVALAGDPTDTVETPGMADLVPWAAFPADDHARDHRTSSGRPFRLRTAHGDRGEVIQVALSRGADEDLLAEYRRRLVYVLGASLVAAVVGGYRLARSGLRPLAAVAATTRRIGPANLGERLNLTGLPAELLDLASTFNLMLDRLEEAFARLNRFSADIAHELRTPLNNLRGETEVALGRSRTPEEYRDVLGSSLEECGRLTQLIDGLLFLARAEDPRAGLVTEPVDAAAELYAVREFFEPAAAEAGVRLEVEAPPGLTVRADRQLLQRAVSNLVSNALSHTPSGGTVTLFAEAGVRVGVRDTGHGIPPDHLAHVFDRFYRADVARSSSHGRVGLGLAIVKAIAELHGGTATVASTGGKGTTVTLTLPTA